MNLDRLRPTDYNGEALRAGDIVHLTSSKLPLDFMLCWGDPFFPHHYPEWFLLYVDANTGSLGDRMPIGYSPLRKIGQGRYPSIIALDQYPDEAPEELRSGEAFNQKPCNLVRETRPVV